MCVSYHIIFMYYVNYEHTGLLWHTGKQVFFLFFLRVLHIVILLVISLLRLINRKPHPQAYFRVDEKGG